MRVCPSRNIRRICVEPRPKYPTLTHNVMNSAAENLMRGHANRSFHNRSAWDSSSNDADLCCESWGGASPEKGGPNRSFVLWGCSGQGHSHWKDGPENFACMGTANMTLERLLKSYFPREEVRG